MSDSRPAEDLVQRWQAGDQTAAEDLFRRYAQRLCALAETLLGRRLAARVGAEDVMQSALRTFFRRAGAGEFQIDQSSSLWQLLVRITLNKARRYGEYHGAAKRDVKAETSLELDQLDRQAIAREPCQTEAVELTEELETVLAGLSRRDREIAHLRLEGRRLAEIADGLGCARRTVSLVLKRVGDLLRKRLAKGTP